MPEDRVTQEKGRNSQSQESSQFLAPAIALPKGGGAIRGMGEKFAANPVTGTGSMSVPIVSQAIQRCTRVLEDKFTVEAACGQS